MGLEGYFPDRINACGIGWQIKPLRKKFTALLMVLRGIGDFALTDEATKEEIARALASVIDVIENAGSKTIQ